MKLHLQLLVLSVIFVLHSPAFAAKKSYVVYLGGHSHGPDVSEAELNRVTDTHHELLGSHIGSVEKAKEAIFYSYNKHINGFAAMLEDEEAEAISKDPRVVSVFLNKRKQLHTTRSWDFLGLGNNGKIPSQSLWKKARFGEDAIVANLDTGVWPESHSFDDVGLGPVPSRWKGGCQNNTKSGVPCSRKLIGAKYFNEGFKLFAAQANLTLDSSVDSTRDVEGHGSHTLSTIAGNFVPNTSLFGFAEGTAKGGSPKARVAAYKVCFKSKNDGGGCFDADILKAFDEAINDGVDILSVSLGGGNFDYFQDAISIGSFHAVQKGIVVVCSGGNSGQPLTVTNLSPWIITVGASTIDRGYDSSVLLGNNKTLKGQSMTVEKLSVKKFYPLIDAEGATAAGAYSNESTLCFPNTLDPEKVKGKIIVCLRGIIGRKDKGLEAKRAGAVGMILANSNMDGEGTAADNYDLPATHITYTQGLAVYGYINSTKSPVAYLTPARTYLNEKPAPYMAYFSSQGPNTITPEILKPDITAPGVNVLAAFSQSKDAEATFIDNVLTPFTLLSGTSMSCPHISGIAGLLKTLNPDWSPSAIKSAIMTTARIRDNVGGQIQRQDMNGTLEEGTPFAYGAGHVWPNSAADPGLVYDLTPNDYLNFLCGLGYNETQLALFASAPYNCPKPYSVLDLNYPSITVPKLSGSVIITRTVKNVGSPGTYRVQIQEPDGISVSVEPKVIDVKKIGEEKTYKVTLKAKSADAAEDYVFGALTWVDGVHSVRSPVVVKAKSKAK